MPRPKRNRDDVVKAALARDARNARNNAAEGGEPNIADGKTTKTTIKFAEQPSKEQQAEVAANSTETDESNEKSPESDKAPQGRRSRAAAAEATAAMNRLAAEEEAASRMLESVPGTAVKPFYTPLAKSTYWLSRQQGQAPSVLKAQQTQDLFDPPTNTRARNVPMAPMSSRKPMSTPRSEASMMALAKFKRRGRAPSILGIGTTDGDDDDDSLSISSGGSFGDLMPDDESTPMPQPMQRPVQSQLDKQLSDQLQQQKASEPETGTQVQVSPQRKRKHGSTQVQVPFSQHLENVRGRKSRGKSNTLEVSSRGVLAGHQSPDQPLPQIPRQWTPPPLPSPTSSILAPPASSSPTKVDRTILAAKGITRKPGRMQRGAAGPGIAKGWAVSPSKDAPRTFDTATLQELLPKRRVLSDNSGALSDGNSSDEGEDQSRPRKRRRTAVSKTSRTALTERTAPVRGTRQSARNTQTSSSDGKSKRTYSRRSADKENESEDASSFAADSDNENAADVSLEDSFVSARAEPPSKELRDAAAKFAQVDQWQMDFEDAGPNLSILVDAR